jgi:hypothetical protein
MCEPEARLGECGRNEVSRILHMRQENGLAKLTLGSPRSAKLTTPHPTAGGATPRTPAMILKGAELSMGVDLIGKGEIGLKDIEAGEQKE